MNTQHWQKQSRISIKGTNVPTVHPQHVQSHKGKYQNVQLPDIHISNVQLQNVQVTKHPGYQTPIYQYFYLSEPTTPQIMLIRGYSHSGSAGSIYFWPPRSASGSISRRYGSGSFYHQAKIERKTSISTVSWLLYDFLIFIFWKMM